MIDKDKRRVKSSPRSPASRFKSTEAKIAKDD